ncbi:DUF3307 domain-containing protein [Hasllibacter sp. MH4015]|uniref:DUF3307 domain-containing protein n=1 Tax=Hasllibacter sp. MH4015 TaxID=2854029 RepID=UPI001CD803ED|nr:DUF3307 domain-containing protein [Hasllibacter sp. MH4015]
MAAYTFSALFLAHVIADYVLQTTWMVVNKKRAIAMAAHIGLVLGTMCLTTLSFHPGFIALALAHLWIDIVKTYAMPEGLGAYVADQLLHIASIAGVALFFPMIWAMSPLADVENLPLYYMIAAGVLFAARGGQYAVATIVARQGLGKSDGVVVGWAERAALCVVLIGGFPILSAAVVAAKGLYLAVRAPGREDLGRKRLILGTIVSLLWGFGVAIPLALVMPMMQ